MQVSADEMHTALIDIISDNRYVRIVKTINTTFERFLLRLNQGWIYGYKSKGNGEIL